MPSERDKDRIVRRVNRLYHDRTQDAFERAHRERFGVQRSFWRQVGRIVLADGDRAASRAGRVVVDLACGTGFVGRTLRPHLRDRDRLIAIDLSEGALDSTKRRWMHEHDAPRTCGLACAAADAQMLPLADASIDLLAMNASLHHVPDPRTTLAEIDRVLRPGGFFALGFEPNRRHFHSAATRRLSQAATRLHWYLSPAQNARRCRARLAWAGPLLAFLPEGRHAGEAGPSEAALCAMINDQLAREGLIDAPLPVPRLLNFVDPHARGDVHGGGLDPHELLAESLPAYEVRLLHCSDYLGETTRFAPNLRRLVDAVFRTLLPRHGSQFSWLVRKPGVSWEETS